ncbi:signal peptidase II [Candidatus Sneabacter namystus]|uniref:signal peptidase II n=1 Tax=Candidatus Sneabacter namystus TaxID=2601646 RepID=UPI00155A3666|nr:signal peptidase II [Candidatus Sneabacter namystus]
MYVKILSSTIIVVIAALDQFSKNALQSYFAQGGGYSLPFVKIIPVWNPGISLGILGELPYSGNLFLVIGTILVTLLYKMILSIRSKRVAILWSMIIGGAVGNLIDRIISGAVFDFIDISLCGKHFPTFNFADCAISLGVLMLLIRSFKSMRR